MKALLLTDYRKLELVEMQVPPIGPSDVLVRVAACGICGSDVHGYDGSSGRRIPPIVMGHEAAGVIAAVGAAVSGLRVGDRVTFDSTISCSDCDDCRHGRVNLCPHRRVYGVSCTDYRQHGAFAEYVGVPQHIVYPLPEGLPFEYAAFVEPISVALHAVSRLSVCPGERAVVVGSGMIGMLMVQALRVAGCSDVIAIDIDSSRLVLAKELGATAIVNSQQVDAVAAVRQLTEGEGPELAADVVGTGDAMATAIHCVRRGGRVALVGNLAVEVSFPLQVAVTRELTLFGCCASSGQYNRAMELVASGAIRVAPSSPQPPPLPMVLAGSNVFIVANQDS